MTIEEWAEKLEWQMERQQGKGNTGIWLEFSEVDELISTLRSISATGWADSELEIQRHVLDLKKIDG